MAGKKTTGRITKRTKKVGTDLEPAAPAPASEAVAGPARVEPTPAEVALVFEVAVPAPAPPPPPAPAFGPLGGAIPVAANDWVAVVYEGAAPHFDHDAGTFVRGTRTRLRAGLAQRLLGRDGFRLA